jgi:hypothetical protein
MAWCLLMPFLPCPSCRAQAELLLDAHAMLAIRDSFMPDREKEALQARNKGTDFKELHHPEKLDLLLRDAVGGRHKLVHLALLLPSTSKKHILKVN